MAGPLERIVYCSHARTPNPEALPNLIQILAVSQRNNARDEISGALAVSRGRYFQVIEGRRTSLDQLLKRLDRDPRHDRLKIVERAGVDRRLFGEWTMVAPTITPDLATEIDAAVDACEAHSERAVTLLLDVLRKQAGEGGLIQA